jgi:putative two-component system response regulator
MARKVRHNPETQDIPVIMVTALSEQAHRLQAVEAGANDFITKPIDRLELHVRVQSLLRQKAQQDEIKAFQNELQAMVEARTRELQRALLDLDKAHVETIHHLAAAAEYKDEDTACHIQRMSAYSALIAQRLGLDAREVELIRISSPMHDVGKIGIPDHILLKPGKLSPEEWATMRTHTQIGGKILCAGVSAYMNMGTVIALSHHEKWDGSGYPSGLSGEQIPLQGRISAVADVFDALTSKRPYKEAFPVPKALDIMHQGRGFHFDPQVLDVFLERMDEVLEIKARFRDEAERSGNCAAR